MVVGDILCHTDCVWYISTSEDGQGESTSSETTDTQLDGDMSELVTPSPDAGPGSDSDNEEGEPPNMSSSSLDSLATSPAMQGVYMFLRVCPMHM